MVLIVLKNLSEFVVFGSVLVLLFCLLFCGGWREIWDVIPEREGNHWRTRRRKKREKKRKAKKEKKREKRKKKREKKKKKKKEKKKRKKEKRKEGKKKKKKNSVSKMGNDDPQKTI